MKQLFILLFFCVALTARGQELYVYSEPASNMPAHSLSAKLNANYIGLQPPYNRFMQRYTGEVMFGLNKNWMLHTGVTFANMHSHNFRSEAAYLYGKYRFFSQDELHSHFRMAVFGEAAYSRNDFHFDEVSLQGDKSGVQLGLIATQLWHKFALSGTVSHIQVLDDSRGDKVAVYIPSRIYQVMNYSLSAGLLLLPFEYTDYRQTNVNLYAELLTQQALDRKAYYADLATAVQVIFNSNTKLNIGYRFQLGSDMQRMATDSWQVGLERTFLNALRKKKK